MAPLAPYRVLELSSLRTVACGLLLADLGADVIAVEPPGGSDARRQPPFYQDQPHPDRSLFWWAFNRNKRSITLELGTADGRQLLRELVRRADFLVEGFAPGYLDSLGLGYQALAGLNPRLIVASITPFGQRGPKAGWAASDLTIVAASSLLSSYGDADRPPVRIPIPQAFLHAGVEAAVACLIAHWERQRSGLGQHIDVSAQAAYTACAQSNTLAGAWGDLNWGRAGPSLAMGRLPLRIHYPCRDGYVALNLNFGGAAAARTRRLMEIVHAEGFCDQSVRDKDWQRYGHLLLSGEEPWEEFQRVLQAVERFCRAHSRQELYQLALREGLWIMPLQQVPDLLQDEQLRARGYWQEVWHPELGRPFTYPGAPFVLSETPLQLRRRPPLLGEHNQEVYGGELGLSGQELALLRAVGAI